MEWSSNGSWHYCRTASQTNVETTHPVAYQMTAKCHWIFHSCCVLRCMERSQLTPHHGSHLTAFQWETVHRDPIKCWDLHNSMYIVAFWDQNWACIMVSMTTYCDAYMVDMDQWYTTNTWSSLHPFNNPRMASSQQDLSTDIFDNARSGSSRHYSKSRWDPIHNKPLHLGDQDQFEWWFLSRLNYSPNEAETEPKYLSNHSDYDNHTTSQLHYYLAPGDIGNQ